MTYGLLTLCPQRVVSPPPVRLSLYATATTRRCGDAGRGACDDVRDTEAPDAIEAHLSYPYLMGDPRRRSRPDRVGFPHRQRLDRARNPTGWRSSLETRPHQSLGSFTIELLIAAAVFVIIVLLVIQFG